MLTPVKVLLSGSYSIEVDEISSVEGATEQRAVVSSESLPSSMEVIGHHVDEVQLPGDMTQHKWIPKSLFQPLKVFVSTHLAISAISYPPSMVPLPADTAAVSMS